MKNSIHNLTKLVNTFLLTTDTDCNIMENEEDKNGMQEVYEECRKLRNVYYKRREHELMYHYSYLDDGERFLKFDVYTKLNEEADNYYQICLEERSYRVPKSNWKKIEDNEKDDASPSEYKKRKINIIRKV